MPRYFRMVFVVAVLFLIVGILYLSVVVLPCARRPSCASLLGTETQLWSAIANTLFVIVAVGQTLVLAGTWLAIRESTREASLLRQETARQAREMAKQVRLSAMPILNVICHRGPDQVRVRNTALASAASAASTILLQPFRFSWQGSTWRCMFEPTGMLAPGQEVRLRVNIDQEPLSATHERAIPPTEVLKTAFRNALIAMPAEMILAMYFEDMIDNCYRADIRIDRMEMERFLETGGGLPIEILSTALIEAFPKSPEPFDGTGNPKLSGVSLPPE